MSGDERFWTVEEANAALPRVRALVERIRELASRIAREREVSSARAVGNGHPPSEQPVHELRAAVEELTTDGIVLRDVRNGLVDFPARLEDGRRYMLCWLVEEPEVGWWHWPEAGFVGRRPLTEPPT